MTPTPRERLVAAIMERTHASSGQAVFVEAVILHKLIEDHLGPELFELQRQVEAGKLREAALQASIDGCAQRVAELRAARAGDQQRLFHLEAALAKQLACIHGKGSYEDCDVCRHAVEHGLPL